MTIITGIKEQKRKNRINVYLDSKFGFGIDLENFVILKLKVGQELTEEEINSIVRKAEFQKTLDKLLRFVTLRPRSKKEVTDWFYRKKVHESMQVELFKKITDFDLLDDKKFALWWVDQRNSFKPRSKKLLLMELQQKGVSKEIVNEVLQETPIDEYETALSLAKKRTRLQEDKMIGYLSRKGFSWEIIRKVIKDLYGHDSIEKEW